MKLPVNIQPRYIIAITLAVAVVMVASAVIELRQSREELYHVMEEEALSLVETIDQSSANNLLSMEQIENLLAERLLNNAFFIARLDSMGKLSATDLAAFAEANHIFRINIFDKGGNRLLSNHSPEEAHASLPSKHAPLDFLQPILNGETNQLVIGLKEARIEEGQRYAVAVRRTRVSGGAIVLNLDAEELLEFRKTIGIGKLINDLGDNSGLEYVVLQDHQGIIAASKTIQEMTPIQSDSILDLAFDTDSTFTRVVPFQGKKVLEVVKPFRLEGTTIGLFRIGISTEDVRATEARMQRRMIVMSIVLLAIGALVVLSIVALQNLKLTEQKFERMQTFTGNILDQMQDAVVTFDPENRITLFNRQAQVLFGLSDAEVLGRKVEDIKHNGESCLTFLLSPHAAYREMSIPCAHDTARDVAVAISETHKPGGTLESRTAVIRDLTDSHRLQREVQRKDKLTAMGELASGVAHEIRNPLNAIMMIAQRLGNEFAPKKGLKEYKSLSGVLKKEAHRVNAIIHQFLTFARPAKVSLHPVSAMDFVEHITALFKSQADAKKVKFSSSILFREEMLIDREQMTQAALNLLQNALDATKAGGSINISLSREANEILLAVKDSGSGIPRDRIEKVFDLYFTTKVNGTGMGLAITQQIVTQHGGRISVSSEVGKETVFEIRIPITERHG